MTMARRRITVLAIASLVALFLGGASNAGGTLDFYESSVGIGSVRAIPSPANNFTFDIRYAPISAEGGGMYGFSELRLVATGDLFFTSVNLACDAFNCLYSPLPFIVSNQILVSAGDELGGEVATALDALTISVTGSAGIIAIESGEYIDATGAGFTPGQVRRIRTTLIATVPEPGLLTGLVPGLLFLAGWGRERRLRLTRES